MTVEDEEGRAVGVESRIATLLGELFTSAELDQLLAELEDGPPGTSNLRAQCPGRTGLSSAQYCLEVVGVLNRRGLLDANFFASLRRLRPRRHVRIDEVCMELREQHGVLEARLEQDADGVDLFLRCDSFRLSSPIRWNLARSAGEVAERVRRWLGIVGEVAIGPLGLQVRVRLEIAGRSLDPWLSLHEQGVSAGDTIAVVVHLRPQSSVDSQSGINLRSNDGRGRWALVEEVLIQAGFGIQI